MVTKNDVTGDSIKSRVSSNAYKDNYDAIFGKKEDNIVYLSDEAFDKLSEMLDKPPKPTQALIDLMKRPKRWAVNEKEEKNDQAV